MPLIVLLEPSESMRLRLIAAVGSLTLSNMMGVAEAAELTLTNAFQVHALPIDEAGRNLPVSLTAAVTYSDVSGILFVSDASGGVFVVQPEPARKFPLGALLNIKGGTGPGDFAPIVKATSIAPTGQTQLPTARLVSFEDLANGSKDSEWVEFQGIVRAVNFHHQTGFPEMRIAARDGQLRVYIDGVQLTNLSRFVDAKVLVRGAVGGIFNQKRQLVAPKLFVPSADQIVVLDSPPAAPFDVPTQAIESLLQYHAGNSYGHRVKLHGTVTFSQSSKQVFMTDGTQGLEVQALSAPNLRVGDRIEALGFPAVAEWSPRLEDAIIRKVGVAPSPPHPVKVTWRQALEGNFDSELVELDARLLDCDLRSDGEALVLQSGGQIFNGFLPRPLEKTHLAKGSDVRLVGICQVQVAGPERYRQSFRILLRDRTDVQVLRRPQWWTMARTLWILAMMTAGVLLALGWVLVLKRRVRAQTEVIRQKLQQATILEERTRIAREFHDTVEQELIGINMQLDAVRAKIQTTPVSALEGLDLARRMIRRAIGEARRSVLDLRSHALQESDLGSALVAVAKPLIDGTGLRLDLRQTGPVRRLPAPIEDNLLRIGQEAITNTIKHARATSLILNLGYERQSVSLSVRDDGRGLREGLDPPGVCGHFGLLGMRERAAQMGARLIIRSFPQTGTEISVKVSLNQFTPDRT